MTASNPPKSPISKDHQIGGAELKHMNFRVIQSIQSTSRQKNLSRGKRLPRLLSIMQRKNRQCPQVQFLSCHFFHFKDRGMLNTSTQRFQRASDIGYHFGMSLKKKTKHEINPTICSFPFHLPFH